MKRIVMILMAVALVALPTMAQQQEWQSTSSLKTSGSTYTPQVSEVGASTPSSVGASYSSSNAPGGPFKAPNPINDDEDWGKREGDIGTGIDTPLGDAVLPLTLMALAYALVVYFRKRKQTLKG